uniref:GAS2-like protein 1 n=1 Tax=Lygus hesperus TaxID=30085 RepID=A0A0A9XFD9_LYGHE
MFVDLLRDGVLLHVLLQKLQTPPVTDTEIKLPRRTTGFFAQDNVSSFLQRAQAMFGLHDAELFTSNDLCQGKNDRQVVTFLLSLAREAYARGATTHLPRLVQYEREIDERRRNLRQAEVEESVMAADAENVVPTDMTQNEAVKTMKSCVCE